MHVGSARRDRVIERCAGGLCPACDSTRDEDADGRPFFVLDPNFSDPGCSGPTDGDERCSGAGCPVCDDGVDNDGDGVADFAYPVLADAAGVVPDPGCWALSDPDERGGGVCDDATDADGDGLAAAGGAAADPGCAGPSDGTEKCRIGGAVPCPDCDDARDGDLDGTRDFRIDGTGDPGCAGPAQLLETCNPASMSCPACDNGMDDDGDGAADSAGDYECLGPLDTSEATP